jgi:glycosyltransferase involved in cell wall biosynthesis
MNSQEYQPLFNSTRPPKVSVCIPTYRGGSALGAAIESVLAQTLTDFELIVIDDASPDDTRALVERYADPRIKYLRNAINLGPQGNWNRCLKVARGRYFKLLPHDDRLKPQSLQRQADILDADAQETIALVFSARDVIGTHGQVITRRGYPSADEGLIPADTLIRACVRRGTNLLGEPGAVLFRKSLASQVGLFDATHPYVIDLDYWFRLLAHGDAYFFPESLAEFRVSKQSWSVAIGSQQSHDFHHFLKQFSSRGRSPATALDHFLGYFTPALNNLARLAFYRFYLR